VLVAQHHCLPAGRISRALSLHLSLDHGGWRFRELTGELWQIVGKIDGIKHVFSLQQSMGDLQDPKMEVR